MAMPMGPRGTTTIERKASVLKNQHKLPDGRPINRKSQSRVETDYFKILVRKERL
jgi:hypothetical protein